MDNVPGTLSPILVVVWHFRILKLKTCERDWVVMAKLVL
jgi:hypothetical protein